MANAWSSGISGQTFLCANLQRSIRFMTDILGLRLAKLTVHHHDERLPVAHFDFGPSRPGSATISYVEWSPIFYAIPEAGLIDQPTACAATDSPRVGASLGRWGGGTNHHLALHVRSRTELLMWKRYLCDRGVHVTGPYFRNYFHAIYFRDPDGAILEIATTEPGFTYDEEVLGSTHQAPKEGAMIGHRSELEVADESWPEPVAAITPEMELQDFHHNTSVSTDIERTTSFLTEVVGLDLIKRTDYLDQAGATHFYFKAAPSVTDGAIMTFFGFPGHEPGRLGVGLSHHISLRARDLEGLEAWRDDLRSKGVEVGGVEDLGYFRCASFRDPDGHILQIATQADFTADGTSGATGEQLCLPPRLESRREEIERRQRLRPAPTPERPVEVGASS